MTLLAPIALWLGALIAVPLAVHLMRRRIGARVDFPATRYLARAEREHSKRLRLRNLLLMMIRIGMVLALAAAAAGPVASLRFGGGATSHAPMALAVVLDNSLSSSLVVQGQPVLDQLKDGVRAALSGLGASDRVWLITLDGDVASGDRASIEDALTRVTPFAGHASLDRATARAVTLLESSSIPERAMLIATDAQASTWENRVSVSGVRVSVFAPPIAGVPNRSVVSASAEPLRWTPRGSINARIAGADSATYRIALAGRTLARGTAESDAAVVVTASPSERGWLTGSVEIEPDELRADDVRHFGVWIGSPPSVTLDPAAGPFVASAVAVLKEASRATEGAGVALVAAENVRTRPALIFAPSQPVQLGAANRALERAGIPWRFASALSGRASVAGAGLAGVEVLSRYRLERLPGGTADTVARVGTEPWIVAGEGYVLVASTMDPSSTSLPVRAAFVPWLADMLSQRLGSEPGTATSVLAGERLAVPRGADALIGPDGSRIATSGQPFIDAPRRTGGFRWVSGSTTLGIVAVNVDSAESRLDRFIGRDILARIQGGNAAVVSDASALTSSLFASSARRELVLPLLILALLLLGLEVVIARDRRPRYATASPAPISGGARS